MEAWLLKPDPTDRAECALLGLTLKAVLCGPYPPCSCSQHQGLQQFVLLWLLLPPLPGQTEPSETIYGQSLGKVPFLSRNGEVTAGGLVGPRRRAPVWGVLGARSYLVKAAMATTCRTASRP